MGRSIDPVITAGTVHGNCPKCREPYMGQMDADEETVELKCVGCGHNGQYFYRWPDELPKVTLRHVSNGRALGSKKRSKKRKQNPDGVLKGQLSFEIPRDHGVFQ